MRASRGRPAYPPHEARVFDADRDGGPGVPDWGSMLSNGLTYLQSTSSYRW
jgi:hypothetical protein